MKSAEEWVKRLEPCGPADSYEKPIDVIRAIQSDAIRAAAEICGTNAAMFENGLCPEPKAMAGGAAQCAVDILSLLPEASK